MLSEGSNSSSAAHLYAIAILALLIVTLTHEKLTQLRTDSVSTCSPSHWDYFGSGCAKTDGSIVCLQDHFHTVAVGERALGTP